MEAKRPQLFPRVISWATPAWRDPPHFQSPLPTPKSGSVGRHLPLLVLSPSPPHWTPASGLGMVTHLMTPPHGSFGPTSRRLLPLPQKDPDSHSARGTHKGDRDARPGGVCTRRAGAGSQKEGRPCRPLSEGGTAHGVEAPRSGQGLASIA